MTIGNAPLLRKLRPSMLVALIGCWNAVNVPPAELIAPRNHGLTMACGRPFSAILGSGDTVQFHVHRIVPTHTEGISECEGVDSKSLQWRVSDSTVLIIDATGYATAIKEGAAIVAAMKGDSVAYRAVRVIPAVTSVRWDLCELELSIGDSAWLHSYAYGFGGRRIEPISALGVRQAGESEAARIASFRRDRGVLVIADAVGELKLEARLGSHADTTIVRVRGP